MNNADIQSPNLLPPPSIDDVPYLMLPPAEYRPLVTPAEAKKAVEYIASGHATSMLGSLAASPEMALTLETAHPEYENKVKVPSARDNEYVYDSAGNQLFNTDGTPKQWAKLGLKVGGFPKTDESSKMTDIEGKELLYVDKGGQKKTTRGWLANKVYNLEDSRMNFMALEAATNEHWGKIVESIKNTGPDHKFRILWSEWNKEGGYWQDYKGKPLSEQQIRSMEHERKVNANNTAYIMACAKYELSKREEELRMGPDGTWSKILNVMHRDLKFDPENMLAAVHVGLTFMRKTEDLTIKHTPIYYEDSVGKKLDPSKMSKKEWASARDKGSCVVLGNLNERAFVTEFATKFGQGDRRFGTGDVAVMAQFAAEIERRLKAAGEDISKKNQRNYQNSAFIASRLLSVVNNSRISSPVSFDSGDDEIARIRQEAERGARPDYPASIYSSAVANDHWRELAKIVDRIAGLPGINSILKTNMSADIDTRGTIRTDNRP
ncbi:hypothetical protein EBQ81_04180 [bacterium]|nr:hypothetical protein [bacterium]